MLNRALCLRCGVYKYEDDFVEDVELLTPLCKKCADVHKQWQPAEPREVLPIDTVYNKGTRGVYKRTYRWGASRPLRWGDSPGKKWGHVSDDVYNSWDSD